VSATVAEYDLWIWHEAFGVECRRRYRGTRLGATRLAARLAREGGFGWRPVIVDAALELA
jgi:hypothetical protein